MLYRRRQDQMKLAVKIKQPEFGKGWYVTYPDCNPATEDSQVLAITLARNPEATAVQITREYPITKKQEAAA